VVWELLETRKCKAQPYSCPEVPFIILNTAHASVCAIGMWMQYKKRCPKKALIIMLTLSALVVVHLKHNSDFIQKQWFGIDFSPERLKC
jgi:hypothetical protein